MRLYPSDDLPELHTYGSGPEQDEIKAEAEGLPGVQVNGGIDHAHPSLHGYRVFVNPSTSDVLCTATAEALAVGANPDPNPDPNPSTNSDPNPDPH